MRQTILLADDSSTIQRLVVQTFVDTGFDIVSVSNGDAAIRKFEEIHPDIVLADIYMPGKNGFEVCAHIKKHASLSSTPVILLVGAFDAFEESTSNRAGAAAYITKPFEPRALIELVKSVLSPEPAKDAPEIHLKETPAPALTPEASDGAADTGDLLGLNELFQPEVVTVPVAVPSILTTEEIDRIADRVIQKLSTQVIENIAWDVVPDIVAKALRDELKKTSS